MLFRSQSGILLSLDCCVRLKKKNDEVWSCSHFIDKIQHFQVASFKISMLTHVAIDNEEHSTNFVLS